VSCFHNTGHKVELVAVRSETVGVAGEFCRIHCSQQFSTSKQPTHIPFCSVHACVFLFANKAPPPPPPPLSPSYRTFRHLDHLTPNSPQAPPLLSLAQAHPEPCLTQDAMQPALPRTLSLHTSGFATSTLPRMLLLLLFVALASSLKRPRHRLLGWSPRCINNIIEVHASCPLPHIHRALAVSA